MFPIPSRSYLYRNDGERFTEVAEEVGVTVPGRYSRQSNWIDFNGNGALDLYAANRSGVNVLLVNDGQDASPQFRRFPHVMGAIDIRRTVGACWFDADRDGDLDLSLTDGYGPTGGHPVLRNELSEAKRSRAFNVRVRDADGLATQAGAELLIVDADGPRSGMRMVNTGGGYNSQSESDVFFVLPDDCGGCTLQVRFMGKNGGRTAEFPIPGDLSELTARTLTVLRSR